MSGWGVEDENDGFLPDVLKWAEIPIVSDEDCVDMYSDFFVKPVESMICAGESGKDHCFVRSPNHVHIFNSRQLYCVTYIIYFMNLFLLLSG